MNTKNYDKEKKLKDCHKKMEVDSCMKCKYIVDCKIRNEYVYEVYTNMNNNIKNGGFEF